MSNVAPPGYWIAWTIKIGNKAYKGINPRELSLHQEIISDARWWQIWRPNTTRPTGRWYLSFVYDHGPFTQKKFDTIYFDSKEDAVAWYDHTYASVFVGQTTSAPPKNPPPKPNKDSGHLRLL